MTLRLAHLTDPHLGPLPFPGLRALLGKRALGWFNWRRGRDDVHDPAVAALALADAEAWGAEHVAVTGDLANIGLADEFPTARAFMAAAGTPERATCIPGNHDAYARDSLAGFVAATGEWMTGDGAPGPDFPFVKRRGGVALVGTCSGVPTPWFVASGALGPGQLARLGEVLADLRREGLARVLLIHHPPHRAGSSPGRDLVDAGELEALLARVGAEAVLHGHNHRVETARIPGPDGPIPVIGGPSASSRLVAGPVRGGWRALDVEPRGPGRARITVTTRLLAPDRGGFVETARETFGD